MSHARRTRQSVAQRLAVSAIVAADGWLDQTWAAGFGAGCDVQEHVTRVPGAIVRRLRRVRARTGSEPLGHDLADEVTQFVIRHTAEVSMSTWSTMPTTAAST